METGTFYKQMVDRNIGVLSSEEQERLRNTCVAVGGCGGMGGLSAEQLVRLGVGHVKIADSDKFEIHNLSRQFGSTSLNVGRNKAEVLARHFREINPELQLDTFTEGVRPENVEKFIEGSEIIIDGMDYSNLKTTILLYRTAKKRNICVVNPNAIGFGVSVFVFGPKTVTIDKYLGLPFTTPGAALEKFVPYRPTYGDHSLIHKAAVGKINIPNIIMPQHLGTAVAVTEAIMIILGKVNPPAGPDPRILVLDLHDRVFRVTG